MRKVILLTYIEMGHFQLFGKSLFHSPENRIFALCFLMDTFSGKKSCSTNVEFKVSK